RDIGPGILSFTDLLLRRWRGGLQSARADSPAASGIAATGENRSREMIHQPELPWSDQDQQFRILKRILPPREQVSGDGDFSEARQASDGASFFGIGEAADQGCFVQLDTNRLRQRAVGDYGRSEEHTSELQSRFDLVCRLLLE